jgi:Zn-dependent M28 family amino/carboxypeptidase
MIATSGCLLFAAAALSLLAATHVPFAFDVHRVDDDIRTLSSDEFEGRGPATRGEVKTVAFIVDRMKAAGLQPGGTIRDGLRGWTQDVPLVEAAIVARPVLSWRRGKVVHALTQGDEIAVQAIPGGDRRTDIRDAPLVFVGYGVKAPERGWDDFKGADLRGKIAVVLINDPDFEARPEDEAYGRFGGKAMTYYGRWTYKFEQAARLGALGCLIIHEDAAASYGWATARNSVIVPQFGVVGDNAEQLRLEAWIRGGMASELLRGAGLDLEHAKKAARQRSFEPIDLHATLSASLAMRMRRVVTHNVMGILPGAQHPDDTVIYSAHWDHLGVGMADSKGDRIYNGARDNASGVAMMLELARAFASGRRPDRSILFIALGAEERGLLGSSYYATHPVYPLETTVADLNMDEVLGQGAARDFSIAGNARLGLLDLLTAEGAKLGRTYTPGSHPEAGGFFREDSFPFAKQGVPAVSFMNGRDLIDGGRARGDALEEAYTRDHYHQPSDEWSPTWDLSAVVPDLTLLEAVGRHLASGGQWPQWGADSEFKIIRDVSASARSGR